MKKVNSFIWKVLGIIGIPILFVAFLSGGELWRFEKGILAVFAILFILQTFFYAWDSVEKENY